MSRTLVADLPEHIGERVTVRGWVRTRRVEEPAGRLADRYAEVFEAFARTEQAMGILETEPVRPA